MCIRDRLYIMKKSDTEQEQPGLEENKVPDSQSKREFDRELQELAENERQEEIYYEERRRERHERNLKRKKRQIRDVYKRQPLI